MTTYTFTSDGTDAPEGQYLVRINGNEITLAWREAPQRWIPWAPPIDGEQAT